MGCGYTYISSNGKPSLRDTLPCFLPSPNYLQKQMYWRTHVFKTWVVLAIYLTIQSSHKHKIKVQQVKSPLKKSPPQKNHKGIANTATNTKGSWGHALKLRMPIITYYWQGSICKPQITKNIPGYLLAAGLSGLAISCTTRTTL